MEPTTRLELVTPSLPRTCSTTELRGLIPLFFLERETGIEPATNGLEGRDSTTELLPRLRLGPLTSNGAGGWIRTTVGNCQQIYSLPPLTTRPRLHNDLAPSPGAGDGTRTRNLLITNQLLCQLSYASSSD